MKKHFVKGWTPKDESFDLTAENFEEKLFEHIKKISDVWDLVELAKEYKFTRLEVYTDD